MKKYMRTTLGRKLAAFYLILFVVSFYFISTFGQRYIYEQVISEAQDSLRAAAITLLSTHSLIQKIPSEP